jgi:hypothetical protein
MRISQSLHNSASQKSLGNDLWNILRRELLIENILGVNGDHRGAGAKPMASSLPDLHFLLQAAIVNFLFESLANFLGSVSSTPGHAYADANFRRIDFSP